MHMWNESVLYACVSFYALLVAYIASLLDDNVLEYLWPPSATLTTAVVYKLCYVLFLPLWCLRHKILQATSISFPTCGCLWYFVDRLYIPWSMWATLSHPLCALGTSGWILASSCCGAHYVFFTYFMLLLLHICWMITSATSFVPCSGQYPSRSAAPHYTAAPFTAALTDFAGCSRSAPAHSPVSQMQSFPKSTQQKPERLTPSPAQIRQSGLARSVPTTFINNYI
jgi:hypothetical protein